MLCVLILFIAVKILVALSIPYIPEVMTQMGLLLMLIASILLVLQAILAISLHLIRHSLAFFSAQQRQNRRTLFIQSRQQQIQQLLAFKTMQIRYFHDLNRKKILEKNNREHIRSLSKNIDQQLLSMKKQLSKSTFKALKQQNKTYRDSLNSEALLELQQTIAKLD